MDILKTLIRFARFVAYYVWNVVATIYAQNVINHKIGL